MGFGKQREQSVVEEKLRTHGSRGVAAAIESGVGALPWPAGVNAWDSGVGRHEK